MTLTAEDVVKRVRTIYGDREKSQIDDDDIFNWITDAQRWLVRKYKPVSSTVLASVSGQSIYSPTGGFISVADVFYDSRQLALTTRKELDASDPYWLGSVASPSGTPRLYWLERNQLRLYPTPDTTGKVISVTSVVLPGSVTKLTDELIIDDGYLEPIVDRCLTRAKEFDEDWQGAAYFKSNAQEGATDASHEESNRGDDSFPVIRDDPADWG